MKRAVAPTKVTAASNWLTRMLVPGRYKLSVRSSELLDASKFCALFGGGGHARAAGCTMGAYLIHPLVKMVLQNQLHFPFESLPQWAGLPLRAALVYALALALTFVLKKLPGVGKLMG